MIELIKEKWVDLGFTTKQLKIKPANLVKEREKHEEQLAYVTAYTNASEPKLVDCYLGKILS